jgi:hypothetical protein
MATTVQRDSRALVPTGTRTAPTLTPAPGRAWRPLRRVGDLARRLPWSVRQALLALALIALYFLVRGLTEGAEPVAVAHAHGIERLEHILGIDVEAGLQSAATRSDRMIDVANWIYIWGHWPVIAATLAWSLLRHRAAYVRLRDAMAISGLLGMAVFVNYPVAPPRLVNDYLVDTVTEKSSSYRVLQPPAFVDRYAAMPSLHVGWDLLVGITLVTTAGWFAFRVIGVLLPVLMSFAVVVTANHYVLDVVVGVAFVLVGYACALWRERRRRHPPDRPQRAARGSSP